MGAVNPPIAPDPDQSVTLTAQLAQDYSSSFSENKEFTVIVPAITDNEAPSIPNIIKSVTSSTTIEIEWEASIDATAGVKGYEVTCNDQKLDITDGLKAKFSGLVPNSEYTVSLLAYDRAGNRSESTSINLKTKESGIIYEGFNYSTGSISEKEGGVGFANSWKIEADWAKASIVETGLSYSVNGLSLQTSQGALSRSSAENPGYIVRSIDLTNSYFSDLFPDAEKAWFQWDNNPESGPGQEVWVSFLAKIDAFDSSGDNEVFLSLSRNYEANGNDLGVKIGYLEKNRVEDVRYWGVTTAGDWNNAVDEDGNSTSDKPKDYYPYARSNKEIVLGETVFLVAKLRHIDGNKARVDLFINPADLSTPPTHPDATAIGNWDNQFNSLKICQGWRNNSLSVFDEFRLGRCFADVVPIDIASDKEALNILFEEGDEINSVTQNITLPTIGKYGATITWTSSCPDTVSTSGIVNRPFYTDINDIDVPVLLTATLTKGTQTTTKDFNLIVKKRKDEIAPSAPQIEISEWTQNSIGITWTESVDKETGIKEYKVFFEDEDAVVVPFGDNRFFKKESLTINTLYSFAVVAVDNAGNESLRQDSIISTKKEESSMVADAKEALEIGFADGDNESSITGNIILLSKGEWESNISWESTNEEIIKTDGTVSRPTYGEHDASVKLTATISIENVSDTKVFDVIVKALSDAIAPSAPNNLKVTNITQTGATLTWDEATDEGSGIKEYQLFTGDELIGTVGKDEGTVNSITELLFADWETYSPNFYAWNSESVVLSTNPSPSDINSSANVLKWHRSSGNAGAGIGASISSELNISGELYSKLCFKVYHSIPGLDNNNIRIEMGGNEIGIYEMKEGEWTEISADISSLGTIESITIQPSIGSNMEGDFYIDDVKFILTHPINKSSYSFNIDNLTENTEYTYVVKAVDFSNNMTGEEISFSTAKSDKSCVEEAKSNLEIVYAEGDNAQSVTQNVTLLKAFENGASIVWESSNSQVVDIDGNVTRPDYLLPNEPVTLTATISKGNEIDTKLFEILVLALTDNVAPSAPLLMNISDIKAHSVLISWSSSKDSESGISHYELSDEQGNLICKIDKELSSYEIVDLNPITEYLFYLTAVDRCGNRSEECEFAFITQNNTGIDSSTLKELIFYPNPFENEFYFTAPESGWATLYYYNEAGQLIYCEQMDLVEGASTKCIGDFLPKGTTFLRIELNGNYYQNKLIKK